MNERIRELAEQAFFDEATSQPSDRMYTFSDYKMEKFAKLIVRECIDTVLDSSVEYATRPQVAIEIK
jgi:hypothetical protein